jgi:hypothetical protein
MLLALISGAVFAYVFSGLANHYRFLMLDIACSTIAGGVAISSIANMLVSSRCYDHRIGALLSSNMSFFMTKMTISPRFFKLGAFGSGMGHRYVQNKVHTSFIPPFVCMTH